MPSYAGWLQVFLYYLRREFMNTFKESNISTTDYCPQFTSFSFVLNYNDQRKCVQCYMHPPSFMHWHRPKDTPPLYSAFCNKIYTAKKKDKGFCKSRPYISLGKHSSIMTTIPHVKKKRIRFMAKGHKQLSRSEIHAVIISKGKSFNCRKRFSNH